MWMRSSTLLIRINSSSRGEESSELKNSVIVTPQCRRHRQYEFDKEAY